MSQQTLLSLFRQEVADQVNNLKQSLPQLKIQPLSTALIEQATQNTHILWGITRIMAIEPAANLAQIMQDCLLATQNQNIVLGAEQIDALLHAGDLLLSMSRSSEGIASKLESWMTDYAWDLQATQKKLTNFLTSGITDKSVPADLPVIDHNPDVSPIYSPDPLQGNYKDDNYIINLFCQEVAAQVIVMNHGLLAIEVNPQSISELEALMRAAHSIKGAARILELDVVVNLAHAMEDCFVAAQANRIALRSEHIDLLLHGVDLLQNITQLSHLEVKSWLAEHPTDFVTTSSEIAAILSGGERAPIRLEPLVIAQKQKSQVAILNVETEKYPSGDRVVKVSADNLNRIMGLAGESLIEANWLQPFADSIIPLKSRLGELSRTMEQLQDALDQNLSLSESREYLRQARQQEQECIDIVGERLNELELYVRRMASLADRLYREVINSHMRPFADGIQGFPRMVRDLGRKLNKQVKLEILGESTAVDRDILQKLAAPLTHILRNSVDHGIELPEERQQVGKAAEGIVRLEAFHRGGMLVITVSDDGRGINRENLIQKIIHKNLVSPDMATQLTDAELMEFLFLPGFSTAQQVTEISGRGVGLDIAKSMAQEVGGTVRAISQPGNGMSFHFQLPLTLSVVRTLLVEISGKPYAIPLARIDQIVTVSRTEIIDVENHQYLPIDSKNIGLIPAYQVLELPAPMHQPELVGIMVISEQYDTYGLVVDKFLGEHDLVVKPLDPRLGKVPDISASSLLPDGSPVLILDVSDLVRSIDNILQERQLDRVNVEIVSDDTVDQRRKILVVDDSITVREMERKLLENQGYNVDTAVNGMEGWSAVRTKHYDLVISDIDMPYMNGIELVRQIKSNPILHSIPVIIISYRDQEEDRLQGLEVGADYYLTKSSFHDDKLINAVIDLIGK